jgi:twitching motility protein PilT
MRISSRRLGEHLAQERVLSRDLLDELLAREAAEGVPLTTLLVQEGVVSERDLAAAVASELGVLLVDLAEQSIRSDVWRLLPAQLAERHLAVALERRPDGIVVAMDDPSDDETVREMAEVLGAPVVPALAPRDELIRLVAQMYTDVAGGVPEPAQPPVEGVRLDDLLRQVLRSGASDLHLTVGVPPVVRSHGELHRLEGASALNGSDVRRLVFGILTQDQRDRLLAQGEIQTSHALPGTGRLRVNAFVQRNSVGAVFRVVPGHVPTPEELALPDEVASLAGHSNGLVLVCGRSGSGTSTTVASLVDRINRYRSCHVLTLEDPIEYLHRHHQAVVNQREIGEDTSDFATGLRHALRQDVDVIVLGDMPDRETLRLALTAAETGHLVIGVVRSVDTAQALERFVDVFPAEQQPQVRVQLAGSFRGAVAQRLVPRLGGGMALALELLLPVPPVIKLLRSGDLSTLQSTIVGGAGSGMRTLDQALADLVQSATVSLDAALDQAVDPDELRYLLSGQGHQ